MKAECRFLKSDHSLPKVETRAEGQRVISGYAAVFYRDGDPSTEFRMAEDLVERIMPGAFSIEGTDIRATYNHNIANVLGRTKNGTLRTFVDDVGLRYEIDAPNTSVANDLIELINRGDVDGSSFTFINIKAEWRREGNVDIRELRKVEVPELGPVALPAYEGTSAGVRAADGDIEPVLAMRAIERGRMSAAEIQDIETELEINTRVAEATSAFDEISNGG